MNGHHESAKSRKLLDEVNMNSVSPPHINVVVTMKDPLAKRNGTNNSSMSRPNSMAHTLPKLGLRRRSTVADPHLQPINLGKSTEILSEDEITEAKLKEIQSKFEEQQNKFINKMNDFQTSMDLLSPYSAQLANRRLSTPNTPNLPTSPIILQKTSLSKPNSPLVPLKPGDGIQLEASSSVPVSPLVNELKANYRELEEQYTKAMKHFTEKEPSRTPSRQRSKSISLATKPKLYK
jgi:arsenate reductase-like glutaredoxin family protein